MACNSQYSRYLEKARSGAYGSNGQMVAGNGFGLVSITNVGGNSVGFLNGPSLNAAWVLAQAPADFGQLSHFLLTGIVAAGKALLFLSSRIPRVPMGSSEI